MYRVIANQNYSIWQQAKNHWENWIIFIFYKGSLGHCPSNHAGHILLLIKYMYNMNTHGIAACLALRYNTNTHIEEWFQNSNLSVNHGDPTCQQGARKYYTARISVDMGCRFGGGMVSGSGGFLHLVMLQF